MSKDKLNMPGGGLLSVPPADPEPPGLGAVRVNCRECFGMEQCISCEEIEAYVRADQTAKIVKELRRDRFFSHERGFAGNIIERMFG